MKKLLIILLLFPLFCTNKGKPGNFAEIFKDLSRTNSNKEYINLYSRGTIKSFSIAKKKGAISADSKISMLGYFSADTNIKVLKSEITATRANVSVQYLHHSVENVIGFKTVFLFKYEDGKWKLDLENEISEIIIRHKKLKIKNYLKDKSAKY